MKKYVLLILVVFFTTSCAGLTYITDRNKNKFMDNVLSGKTQAVEQDLKTMEKKDKTGSVLFFQGYYLAYTKSYKRANAVLSEFIDKYPNNRYVREAVLLRRVMEDMDTLEQEKDHLQGASVHFETTLAEVSSNVEQCKDDIKQFQEICTQIDNQQEKINALPFVQRLKEQCAQLEQESSEKQ
ncbi:MAG TPA: hypothetical protein VJL89_11610 [Thermodesulfovibrionia bacterium]|nr:hypothetical protein [Thermodesulfovibrionia bacterium]